MRQIRCWFERYFQKEINPMKKRILTVLAAMLLVLPAKLAAQQENFPHVLPPHSAVAGKTLGEWSAVWWKWAYAIPANDNPLLDLSGQKSKFGDVGRSSSLLACSMPRGA